MRIENCKTAIRTPLQGFWGLWRVTQGAALGWYKAAPLALGMAVALMAASAWGQAWTFRDPTFAHGGVSVPPILLPPLANLTWWLAADNGAKNTSGTACAEGDGVATWINNGPAGGVGPSMVLPGAPPCGFIWQATSGPNGKPSVTGTTDLQGGFLKSSGGGSDAGWPVYCFVVLKVDTAGGEPVLWCCNAANNTVQLDYTGGFGCGVNQLVVYVPGATPYCRQAMPDLSGWTLLTFCYNGASSFIRVNGTQTSTFDLGSNARDFSELCLGDTWNGGPYQFLGELPELLIYRARTFTSADLAAVETYLQTKYGL